LRSSVITDLKICLKWRRLKIDRLPFVNIFNCNFILICCYSNIKCTTLQGPSWSWSVGYSKTCLNQMPLGLENLFSLDRCLVYTGSNYNVHRHLVGRTVKSVWFRQVYGLLRIRFRQVSIYNYQWNQCLSPLKLWVRTLFMARCTRYNITLYVIKFVSDLRQVSVFFCIFRFPPPIKLTAKILLKVALNTINQPKPQHYN